MEKVKGCFFLHIPMATKHGTFQWPPTMGSFNGHQAWDLPLTTKHGIFQWPPSMEHSIGHEAWNIPMATKHGTFQWPPSMEHSNGHQPWIHLHLLLLLFKRRACIIRGSLSCLRDHFDSILNTCSTSSSRRERMMSVRRGRKEVK